MFFMLARNRTSNASPTTGMAPIVVSGNGGNPVLFVTVLFFVATLGGAAVFAARQEWLPGTWNDEK